MQNLYTAELMVVPVDLTNFGRLIIASACGIGNAEHNPLMEVKHLVDYCLQTRTSLILNCDVNAHHTVWGNTNLSNRSADLLDFLKSSDVDKVNVGNILTFECAARADVLYFILCSTRILN